MSVNTNAGALIALQNLNATNRSLETTQNRINTGLKVNGYKDNSAVFAIAQNLRADQSGLNAVKSSLDNASSVLDVTLAAGEAVSDILNQMKEKATAAADPSIDDNSRTALNNDLQALSKQITTIVTNATFNGVNILDGATSTDGVKALVSGDLNSSGKIQTITVAAQNITVSGLAVDSLSIASAAGAESAMAAIDSAATTLNTAMASIGSGAKAVEAQRIFVDKLSNAIETGIGNLVDADLAKESAKLQSLQVKQQLGIQALSIANQAPSVVLSLFR
jgi:flagellin